MPPLSFLSSSDEVWVFATSPEWCVLASLCPSSDNGNAGGRGNRKSSWPGKGLAGLWFCLLLEQPQGFSFIATSGTRTKNSDKKKNHSFKVNSFLWPWISFFSATPCLPPRVLRQTEYFLLFYHFILPVCSGNPNLSPLSFPGLPLPSQSSSFRVIFGNRLPFIVWISFDSMCRGKILFGCSLNLKTYWIGVTGQT